MTKQRNLTVAERDVLRARGSATEMRSFVWSHVFGAAYMTGVGFGILILAWDVVVNWTAFPFPPAREIKWWLFVLSASFVVACLVPSVLQDLRWMKSPTRYAAKIDADLDGGVASIEVLDVVEVCEIEETSDEGAAFLLSLRDGRVLFLIGQYLYPYAMNAEIEEIEFQETVFPNTQIERTYARNSGYVFETRGLGAYLKPKALLRWPEGAITADPYLGSEPDNFQPGPIDAIIERAGFIPVPVTSGQTRVMAERGEGPPPDDGESR